MSSCHKNPPLKCSIMSWGALKSTFSQFNTLKSSQNRRNSDKRRRSTLPVIKSKRPRFLTNTSAASLIVDKEESDEGIDYDPDYDDYCNGCLQRSSKEILPLISCKSSESILTRSNRLPLRERYENGTAQKSSCCRPLSSNEQTSLRKSDSQKSAWKPLEPTLREIQYEKRALQESIVDTDSDVSENAENIFTNNLEIETQSSSGNSEETAQRTKHKSPNINHPASSYTQLPNTESCRKIRCRKGGYVAKLRHAVERNKSDYAFWYHAQRSGFYVEGFTTVIQETIFDYGRTILKIDNARGEDILIGVWNNDKYSVGSEIHIDLDPHYYIVNGMKCYLGFNKIVLLGVLNKFF